MKHSITFQPVPRETFTAVDGLMNIFEDPLNSYIDQLLWWNKRLNLVSRGVSRETIHQHVRHSLLLSQFEVFKNSDLILDAGAGGGLAGIPLAVIHPEKEFLFDDIVSKKVRAVRQMLLKLNLENARTSDLPIEQVRSDNPLLLISKHAFKINELYYQTGPLPWKQMVFFKGEDFRKELKGIASSFKITVHALSENGDNAFYDGKVIVIVSR